MRKSKSGLIIMRGQEGAHDGIVQSGQPQLHSLARAFSGLEFAPEPHLQW